MNLEAYKAAFKSPEARAWIQSLPPAVRERARLAGLLKPYIPPPSYHLPLNEEIGISSKKATFDENDFAFEAVQNSGNLDYPAHYEADEEEA